MALTRLFVHDTFYDATDNFTYTPGMRLTLDNTTQSARITRLQNSGVVSTDETIDPSGVAITGGNIDGTVIGATTAAAGNFTTLTASGDLTVGTTNVMVYDESAGAITISRAQSYLVSDLGDWLIRALDDIFVQTGVSNTTRILITDGGDVSFYDSTGASQNLFWDASTSRLGIGNTSPSYALDVTGDIRATGGAATAGYVRIGADNGTNETHLYQLTNDDFYILNNNNAGAIFIRARDSGGTARTLIAADTTSGVRLYDNAGSEAVRVTTAGDVGIGTTSPGDALHVEGGGVVIDSGTAAYAPSGAGMYGLGLHYESDSGLANIAAFAGGSTNLALSTTNAGTRNEVIRITFDELVGINETAPDYRLDVNGTFGFTPGTSVTPVDNGDVVFEATNNTTFTVKLKGTDGTVRSGTVTLA